MAELIELRCRIDKSIQTGYIQALLKEAPNASRF
jgi:hypothetical protein